MIWIEAALAFAVVMIIFSTLTTSVVEILHQGFGLRQKILRRIVTDFYDDVIWPHCRAAFSFTSAADEQRIRDAVLNKLVANPALSGPTAGKEKSWVPKQLTIRTDERSLTPVQLLERLAQTEVGESLVAQSKGQIDALLIEFMRRFEAAGAGATHYFQAQARLFAILVGIVIAATVNVDAVRIFKSFLNNPELASAFADRGEEFYQNAIETQARLDSYLKSQNKNEPAKADQAPAPVVAPIAVVPVEQKSLDAIKADLDGIGRDIAKLTDQGLPIGSLYFPYCNNANSPDEACAADQREDPLNYVAWFFRILATGFLIGLGAPFWYRIFTRLSAVRQVARTLGALVPRRKEDGAQQAQGTMPKSPREEKEEETRDAIEAFKNSITVAPVSPPGRQLLDDDGTVMTEDRL